MFISSIKCAHLKDKKRENFVNYEIIKKIDFKEIDFQNNYEEYKDEDEDNIFFKDLIEEEKEEIKLGIPFLCLICGLQTNDKNEMENHYIETKHFLGVNLLDASLWCFECFNPIDKELRGAPIKLDEEIIEILKYHLEILTEKILNVHFEKIFLKEDIYKIKYNNFISLFKSGNFKNIIIMVGAGISTTAGIPDFRSKTGLFKQLQDKYGLHSPEEFFYKTTFLNHPEYFYEFLKIFDLSQTKPTLTHKFINYMIQKNNVNYLFSQNIDDLELKAKIPRDKIIFAHGTFSEGHCPKCNKNIDINIINEGVKNQQIVYCDACNAPCKPKIVFYGENLSEEFYEKANQSKNSDLVIIMGTSMQVYPFAAIPKLLDPNSWKVVFNFNEVGNFKFDFLTKNSLFIQGKTDNNVIKFLNDVNLLEDFKEFNKNIYGEYIEPKQDNPMISVK